MDDLLDVKTSRQKLGLTQFELAIKLKVTPITVSRYERGVQRLSPKVRHRLLRLLNKSNHQGAK